jgi:glyoxylase I family protein
MIEVAGIDHIVLRTTRLPEMLDFYVKILGCSIERETPEDIGLTQLRAGSSLIDLVAVKSRLGKIGGGAPTLTENNLDHFCLQIKAIAESEMVQYLRENGIETPEFEHRYGAQGMGNSIYIKDPEQNVVELRVRLQQ